MKFVWNLQSGPTDAQNVKKGTVGYMKGLAKKVALLASESAYARAAAQELSERYHFSKLDEAEVVLVIGGDGFMLDVLHKHSQENLAFYGMNLGTVGFLLNPVEYDNLDKKLLLAEEARITPLRCEAKTSDGATHVLYAFNDVSVIRQHTQSAHLEIMTDGVTRIERLIGDGALVATPAGSSAYNASAGGPVLPLTSELLALTPICSSSHRHWRGALLGSQSVISMVNHDPLKRPVVADVDSERVENVTQVTISSDPVRGARLLFDPGHELEERIRGLQFT